MCTTATYRPIIPHIPSFDDESDIRVYYNVQTDERRRDLPLALLNEALEDGLGGGVACGWAGSWGPDMYKDGK